MYRVLLLTGSTPVRVTTDSPQVLAAQFSVEPIIIKIVQWIGSCKSTGSVAKSRKVLVC